jgi:hypothetical protein
MNTEHTEPENEKIINCFPKETIKKVSNTKPKKNRVIIQNWILQPEDYILENQFYFLLETNLPDKKYQTKIALQQINAKIQGYKSQDLLKSIFNPNEFVSMDYVLELLKKTEMKCYYCQTQLRILYMLVREPTQWTLDRIDNKLGHNKTNVVISCLKCNLKRRCMLHNKFTQTKQLKIVKLT